MPGPSCVCHHASTTQVKDILTYCLKPRGRGAIQKKVGLKNRENFRKNILRPLLKDNLIKMTDPDNLTNPKQKYVTTEKGKKLI
ncbi:MAG: Fic family protein [Elusimicrobiota bacterium]